MFLFFSSCIWWIKKKTKKKNTNTGTKDLACFKHLKTLSPFLLTAATPEDQHYKGSTQVLSGWVAFFQTHATAYLKARVLCVCVCVCVCITFTCFFNTMQSPSLFMYDGAKRVKLYSHSDEKQLSTTPEMTKRHRNTIQFNFLCAY